ncbi:hypothetical protein ACVGVM_13255 [Pseudonocardia bannensis]|uniref:Uncharacterized protein n=1 Tax=Pseudonocardia bannensis TaxID=630973 RepID=A0A848DDE7_9PSEU|nr:hypothetical protein [Pseudonocardia bannensis]NMH90603.1 hypothetical protein [Pseudonocardia bannensis]
MAMQVFDVGTTGGAFLWPVPGRALPLTSGIPAVDLATAAGGAPADRAAPLAAPAPIGSEGAASA